MGKYLFLVACLVWNISVAQVQQLSPQAEISIITSQQGQEALFTTFGHSAIRVYDPVQGIDLSYNYGIFDFDQPGFYLNYTRGHLNYKLGVREFFRSLRVYQYYNRYVDEQVLNLTMEEKQSLYNFLVENARPENMFYLYDYFYDNCATRVWDALEDATPNPLVINEDFEALELSFRDVVDECTRYHPWGDFGIDLCLGLPMDKKMSRREYLFLPDYLFLAAKTGGFEDPEGFRPLVKETKRVIPGGEQDYSVSFFTPNVVFWSLAVIIALITVWNLRANTKFRGLDATLFIVFGLIGVLLFLLWTVTDHRAAANNLNLFWAIPSHLAAGIALIAKPTAGWIRKYFQISWIWMLLVIVFWWAIPQGYNAAFLPIAGMLMIRSWFIARTY